MFRARLKLSEQGTLERRYEFHLAEAVRAALLGDQEKAAGHSACALLISRKLYASAQDPRRHRPALAAALASHARYESALASVALLTESAGHYAALAAVEPQRYDAERIDVLVRVALTVEASGNTKDAIRLLREVVGMCRQAPADDPAVRAAGLAKACFHLGRCLLKSGCATEALTYTDEGLRAANTVLRGLLREAESGWLSKAPRQVQLLSPDWIAAATRAMTMHAAAGHWSAAATAARSAVRVSGALAALGGEGRQKTHTDILGRARTIWARARPPVSLTPNPPCPPGTPCSPGTLCSPGSPCSPETPWDTTRASACTCPRASRP